MDVEKVKSVAGAEGETWLAHDVDEQNKFVIGCIVCAELLDDGDKDIVAKFGLSKMS